MRLIAGANGIQMQEYFGRQPFDVAGPFFAPEERGERWYRQHSVPEEKEAAQLVPFTMVRDEDSWLRSYYQSQKDTAAWRPGRWLDEVAAGGEVSRANFIRAVKAARPGFVAQLMHAYISSFARVAVLRTDNLVDQFPILLSAVGLPQPPKIPMPLNVSSENDRDGD
jgi:hypothetical protein